MIRRWLSRLSTQIMLVTAATVLVSLVTVSLLTVSVVERTLFPELADTAETEAVHARRAVERALTLGIPLTALAGVDDLKAAMADTDPSLAFLAIADAEGVIHHAEGITPDALTDLLSLPPDALPAPAADDQALRGAYLVTAVPLGPSDAFQGALYTGHYRDALLQPLIDNLADIVIVLLVATLLAVELMLLVMTVNVVQPSRVAARALEEVRRGRFGTLIGDIPKGDFGRLIGRLNGLLRRAAAKAGVTPREEREPRLIGVRLLAFLFVLAEELARPFMPTFFAEVGDGLAGLDPTRAVGVIMGLHMIGVALTMPVASLLYDRLGRRMMYVIGAGLASAGLAATAFAGSFEMLAAVRLVSAVGYAFTFVACQGFVLESTARANRAQGAGMMVAGIMLADICGPAIGGILASHIGQAETFILGGATAAMAAFLVPSLMGRGSDHAETPPRITRHTLTDVLGNGYFLGLLLFASVPAKVLLSGFLFFLVPVALHQEGASTAAIGRVVMIYGLIALLSGPLLARLADRLQHHALAVAAGGLLSAAGILAASQVMGAWAITGAVAALGLGQAMSMAAQVTAATDACHKAIAIHGNGPVLAVLRLFERLGGGFGPVIAAALMVPLGIQGAIGAIGLYGALSACVFALILARRRGRPPPLGRGGAAMTLVRRRVLLALLIALLGVLTALPAAAAPLRVVMILWRGETEVEQGFRAYMAESGLDVAYDIRDLNRDLDRLPAVLADIRANPPDLVYTWGTSITLRAAGQHDAPEGPAVGDVPVVFALVSDPWKTGIMPPDPTMGRAQVTGASHIAPLEAQIRAIRTYRPFHRLGVIYNPREANSVANVEALRREGGRAGLTVLEAPAPLDADGEPKADSIPSLVANLADQGAELLYIGPDNFVGAHHDTLTEEGIARGLPSFTGTELEIRHGTAMFGLVSRYDMVGRLAASKVVAILRDGVPARDIPAETLERFTYLVRLPVARRLELYPPLLLLEYAEVLR